MNQVLALVLTIVAVAAGQSSAWAAATFTVTNSGSTFTITRSGNTAVSETVNYRTVSLSAIEGQHFTAASGTLTFAADETSKTVTVTESTPGTDAYKYQTGSASRTYRFEVTDLGGYLIAYKDRSISSGLTKFSGDKVSKSVSYLVKMNSNGNFTSDMSSSKYLDVTYTPPTSDVEATNKNNLLGYVLIDDEYDYAQKPATVSTATLIGSTGAPASYLNTLGYKIYATVCYTEKEKDDGYQYLQIVAGTASSGYDTGADPNGAVNDPANSVYKVCFEFANGSNSEGNIFFPHRFSSNGEFSNSDGVQHEYKFKDGDNWKYDGSGAVILPVTTGSITTRFDAGGNNDDTWGYKDLFVRMALQDGTAPTRLGDPVVAPGHYGAGTTVYISVPFSEMVTASSDVSLHTDWGDFACVSGSGSNVLTFSGTIPSTFGAQLITRSISGTITDLAGNALASTDCYKQFSSITVALPWGGSGTSGDPYVITRAAQLDYMATRVNANYGADSFNGKYFVLADDIAYSHTIDWNTYSWASSTTENNFTPIGCYGRSLEIQGHFDGQGHTVSGCTSAVTLTAAYTSSDDYAAVVGINYSEGTIENCLALGATIPVMQDYYGVIVGYNSNGTITANYYRDCTVGSTANAVGVGAGNSSDVPTDVDSARSVHTLTLPDGVTATGESVEISGTTYYAAGTAVTLDNSGSAPTGYVEPCYYNFDGTNISGNTVTMPASDATVGTLYRDGDWNTLCLPFPMSAAQVTAQLAPTALMTLESSSFADGTLTLNFENATEIVAGTPYIIKWPAADNLVSPTFTDVTIPDGYTDTEAINTALATAAVSTTYADFRGIFAPVPFAANDRTKLFLGDANTLYYPNAAMTVGSFRAYFTLNGLTAGDVQHARLYFGEDGNAGDPARIIAVGAGEGARAPHGWYTLDGRKLDSVGPVPAHLPKGLYIVNGKKIVIK